MGKGARGTIVEFEKCSFSYRTSRGLIEVISDSDLIVHEEESIRLTGPSGSGKTTIAMLCAGLLKPTSGNVRIYQDPSRRSSSSPVQIVFQDPYASLNPRRRIVDWLRLAAGMRFWRFGNRRRNGTQDFEHELLDLSEMAGLNRSLFARYPMELSGGECQRVTIIAAILAKPRCIIFDEPFSMQDSASADFIARTIQHAMERCSFTSLIISHRDYPIAHSDTILYELKDQRIQKR